MGSLPFIVKEGFLILHISNVGQVAHISYHGVFLWSLEEDLPDVVPMLFHHGEVTWMLVYRKYVGDGALRGQKTVYEVVAYGDRLHQLHPESVNGVSLAADFLLERHLVDLPSFQINLRLHLSNLELVDPEQNEDEDQQGLRSLLHLRPSSSLKDANLIIRLSLTSISDLELSICGGGGSVEREFRYGGEGSAGCCGEGDFDEDRITNLCFCTLFAGVNGNPAKIFSNSIILTDGRPESLPESGWKVRRRSAGDLVKGQLKTL
ncbi:hypothetical protein ACLB2K_022196 [Fragaria x ananassa]